MQASAGSVNLSRRHSKVDADLSIQRPKAVPRAPTICPRSLMVRYSKLCGLGRAVVVPFSQRNALASEIP
jgi:hypothetical protein